MNFIGKSKISIIGLRRTTFFLKSNISIRSQIIYIRPLSSSHNYTGGPDLKRHVHSEVKTNPGKSTSAEPYQNEQIMKLIKKSKMLSKLQADPRFSHYFKKITTSGTIPMITSFFILHELTAIVPLFTVWYILYNLSLLENLEFSGELMTKCSNAIEKLVGDKYQEYDKHRLILSGALSYALVKVMGPVRIIISLWGAPYFCRWLIMPFKKLANLIKL
ncbi:similar to Saccharomyces cerevisiae YPL041C Protein of unknown function involved in maintenance of proper telomere length [Maudiozyma barnettii]|uniref:Uncharacterized protein n=1 Tax=Maudiozyma barnettii TaxID=61262 RepID=A0A8H2ZI90_9SACH|nr:Mrx11p [Kazachstania barnettii]CAB4256629.1 similar to Saccharomyces cerevisiae YPL041C Protein of unknown function involved in maintenance of proper telomere length [Kazachstania barnettii]CAD1785232.1 similar to Saccharomyces cerevisiae YPL041C Protein of unknown function involved in maintenance of proper telomere length [Kazachstania barnettii]